MQPCYHVIVFIISKYLTVKTERAIVNTLAFLIVTPEVLCNISANTDKLPLFDFGCMPSKCAESGTMFTLSNAFKIFPFLNAGPSAKKMVLISVYSLSYPCLPLQQPGKFLSSKIQPLSARINIGGIFLSLR